MHLFASKYAFVFYLAAPSVWLTGRVGVWRWTFTCPIRKLTKHASNNKSLKMLHSIASSLPRVGKVWAEYDYPQLNRIHTSFKHFSDSIARKTNMYGMIVRLMQHFTSDNKINLISQNGCAIEWLSKSWIKNSIKPHWVKCVLRHFYYSANIQQKLVLP